jgi:hypothetical protein
VQLLKPKKLGKLRQKPRPLQLLLRPKKKL